ncbi:hypothetical protein BDQ17DRAFT_1423094 [Cyathus striatus]|nr:hypothetical protein BDQ17DRAFT_1423094 [Cyathus striatus]
MSTTFVPPTCVHMPGRHHHSAPKYNEDPRTLQRFLSDVQATCINSGRYFDTDYIKWAVYYAPIGDAELWEELDSRKGSSWKDFTAELLKLYPGSGSETERLYSEAELEYFVERNVHLPMDSRLRLGEYHREFLRMYNYLLKHGRISEREASKSFMRGFNISFRTRLQGYLQMTDPKHHPHDPFPINSVVEAATLLLSSPTSSFPFAAFDIQPIAPSPPAPIVSKENVDTKALENFVPGPGSSQIMPPITKDKLAANFARVRVHNVLATSRHPSALLSSSPALSGRPQREVCVFCSGITHVIRDCGVLNDYLRRTLCIRDLTNRIVLPNGQPITGYLIGNNLRERVDSWHRMCAPPTSPPVPAPPTSTNHSLVYSRTDSMAPKVTIVPTPIISVPPPPPASISSPEVENGVIESDDFARPKNSRDILDEDLRLIEVEDTVLSCMPQTRSQIESIPPPPDPECDDNSSVVTTQHEPPANTSNPEAVVSTAATPHEERTESLRRTDIKNPPLRSPPISVKSYAYTSIDSPPNAFSAGSSSSSSNQFEVSKENEEVTQPRIDISPQEVSNCKKDFIIASYLVVTPLPEVAHELSSKLSKDFEDLPIPPTTHPPNFINPFPLRTCASLSTLSFDVNVKRYGRLKAINIPSPSTPLLCRGSVKLPAISKTLFTGNDTPSISSHTLFSWYIVFYLLWILSQVVLHAGSFTAFRSLVPCWSLSSHTEPPFCIRIIPSLPPPLFSFNFGPPTFGYFT